MINRKRDSPFGLIAHRYWERLVDRILVTEHGYEPSEGEVLSAYNDLKERHPECEWGYGSRWISIRRARLSSLS